MPARNHPHEHSVYKLVKSLIVYNACGIKRDNTLLYPRYMDKLVNQRYKNDVKIVFSSCLPRAHTIPYLRERFPGIDFLEVKEPLPVNVTFNHAILKSVDKYGKFDNYTFFTSDSLLQNETGMQDLFDSIQGNEKCGMLSAQIDVDSCYAYGLKLGGGRFAIDDERARAEMFKYNSDYTVPVGRACAAHVNVYSSKIFNFYGRCCPDIFAGYCTESIFTFLNSALKLNWLISNKTLIHHDAGMDGPSSSTDPEGHKVNNPRSGSYDHAFRQKSLLHIFQNETAKKIGLGYEECQNISMHDPSQFKNNECINEHLKQYIRDNLFLSRGLFDYDNIDSVHTP